MRTTLISVFILLTLIKIQAADLIEFRVIKCNTFGGIVNPENGIINMNLFGDTLFLEICKGYFCDLEFSSRIEYDKVLRIYNDTIGQFADCGCPYLFQYKIAGIKSLPDSIFIDNMLIERNIQSLVYWKQDKTTKKWRPIDETDLGLYEYYTPSAVPIGGWSELHQFVNGQVKNKFGKVSGFCVVEFWITGEGKIDSAEITRGFDDEIDNFILGLMKNISWKTLEVEGEYIKTHTTHNFGINTKT